MTSAFPFVPRSVSKTRRTPAQHVPTTTVSRPQPAPPEKYQASVPSTANVDKTSTRDKVKYSDEGYIALICLALSDYALWADPDLRRKIEWSRDEQGRDGFFPLSYLLKNSQLLAPLNLGDLQIPIAKALRSGAADVPEVRLLVSDPSSSAWFGGRDESKDVGAYEIRRKDWADDSTRLSRNYSKVDWDRRTVYVENIPLQYKNIPAVIRFVLALLAEHPSSTAPLSRVQSISFPPHHQDKPGDQPTFKGFALLVLKDEHDVDFLLQRWPWNRQHAPAAQPAEPESKDSEDAQEALKFGFRVLSKLRWDQLKDEYLSYRARLVAEINAHQEAELRPVAAAPQQVAPAADTKVAPEREGVKADGEVEKPPTLDLSSPYPFNSLVFVRHIHPETNKTTLRKFFATAFGPALASGELQGDGLDYVDYNKGMDACHVRLATPKHAHILVDHFYHHPTAQKQGLDEAGAPPDEESRAVAVELVTGRREAVYWEKVPEKVRRQAVQKAVAALRGPNAVVSGEGEGDASRAEEDARRRKRRKR